MEFMSLNLPLIWAEMGADWRQAWFSRRAVDVHCNKENISYVAEVINAVSLRFMQHWLNNFHFNPLSKWYVKSNDYRLTN